MTQRVDVRSPRNTPLNPPESPLSPPLPPPARHLAWLDEYLFEVGPWRCCAVSWGGNTKVNSGPSWRCPQSVRRSAGTRSATVPWGVLLGGACACVWGREGVEELLRGLCWGWSRLGREEDREGLFQQWELSVQRPRDLEEQGIQEAECAPLCKDEVPSAPPYGGLVTCLCWGSPEAVWRETQSSFHITVSRLLVFTLSPSYEGPARKS